MFRKVIISFANLTLRARPRSYCHNTNEISSSVYMMPISTCEEQSLQTHVPVMANEVIDLLDPKDGQVIVDMTFGSGGHTQHILKAANNLTVFALDRDPIAYNTAQEMSEKWKTRGRIIPMLGRFSDLDELFQKLGINEDSIDGMLFDVGVSSMQLSDTKRGFALSSNGPLDMRMDGGRIQNQPAAYDVINHADEKTLAQVLKVYGDESLAKPIARAIVDARYLMQNISTTHELAAIVASVSNSIRTDKIGRPAHIATKTFQALRIFVNNELNELNFGMEVAHKYLRHGGRLVVLTFHSLEDRIVKRHFKGIDMDEAISLSLSAKYKNSAKWHSIEEVGDIYSKQWTLINKHVLTPTEEEITNNPRSRSAKLRAAIKN